MWVLFHLGPIKNEKGEVMLFLVTLKDITEFKDPIVGTGKKQNLLLSLWNKQEQEQEPISGSLYLSWFLKSTLSWVHLSLEQLFPSQSIIFLLSKPRIAKSNFATHQLDRIIIALFVLGKTYVVEPIFLLNLYWQKKCTLTVLEWSHFCLHCLGRICPKSFIFQDSEMKKVEEIWILRFDIFLLGCFWISILTTSSMRYL